MTLRIQMALVAALPLVACAQGVDAPGSQTAAVAPAAAAAQPVAPGDPRIALAARIPDTRPEDLRATPVPGVYEISHGADVSYVTVDAKYVFAGDLYQVTEDGEFPNLSEARRRELRLAKVAAIPESEMLVFGPADAPHTVTVFTDVDCPWCQRLHSQIADYNKLGVRVRYLAFPRSGPDTESWAKAEAVWCSANRNDAFTRASEGKDLKPASCPTAHVARDYALGRELGVTGTPGMLLETGEMVPGYLSPTQLIAHLRESAAEAAARK